MLLKRICLLLIIPFSLHASPKKIQTLYSSLNPTSISENLAFYELYPDTTEGKRALNRSWQLLEGTTTPEGYLSEYVFDPYTIDGIVRLVNKQPNQQLPKLNDFQLEMIERIAKRLFNRQLKGFYATTEDEIIQLPSHEIDLSRALLLTQVDTFDSFNQIRSYEAMIDLMALQILAKLPPNPTNERKIRAINDFIFSEMGFRFPPHSKYANDIDLYTFLPSVLDSRHGVCLGVSILYLSIAQRLNLPLEVVTPPGHIYIRYRDGNKITNIETTARGIHIDCEDYLGIDTRKLQTREIKEVVGLSHINHASIFIKENKFSDALACYQKALPYLEEDTQLTELMGYCYLFTEQEEKGKALLQSIANVTPDHAVIKSTLADDYLTGRADVESIKTIFLPVDETRESILKKKEALEIALDKHPQFRNGWQALGIAWLQLHRSKEALQVLNEFHEQDPTDPTVEYYLAIINHTRLDYKKAWKHLNQAEQIVLARDHRPKALKHLRRQLTRSSPE